MSRPLCHGRQHIHRLTALACEHLRWGSVFLPTREMYAESVVRNCHGSVLYNTLGPLDSFNKSSLRLQGRFLQRKTISTDKGSGELTRQRFQVAHRYSRQVFWLLGASQSTGLIVCSQVSGLLVPFTLFYT